VTSPIPGGIAPRGSTCLKPGIRHAVAKQGQMKLVHVFLRMAKIAGASVF